MRVIKVFLFWCVGHSLLFNEYNCVCKTYIGGIGIFAQSRSRSRSRRRSRSHRALTKEKKFHPRHTDRGRPLYDDAYFNLIHLSQTECSAVIRCLCVCVRARALRRPNLLRLLLRAHTYVRIRGYTPYTNRKNNDNVRTCYTGLHVPGGLCVVAGCTVYTYDFDSVHEGPHPPAPLSLLNTAPQC